MGHQIGASEDDEEKHQKWMRKALEEARKVKGLNPKVAIYVGVLFLRCQSSDFAHLSPTNIGWDAVLNWGDQELPRLVRPHVQRKTDLWMDKL